jgi:demethylmenaquinone methyltransferase/2-methoxy-6-polyprenyl-1,4-benzoquinol methylase
VVPALGGWLAGDRPAYRYLARSVEAFLDPEGLRELLRSAGLGEVTLERFTGGIAILATGRRMDHSEADREASAGGSS